MHVNDDQTERELRLLVSHLKTWKQKFLQEGGSQEAFGAIRLAIELDPEGDQIAAGVPICAPGHAFPIGVVAKGIALTRFCIDHLEECGTPLWREKRQAAERLYREHVICEALEPELAQVRRWKEQRSQAGRKGGHAGEARNETREKVGAHWNRLAAAGVPERDRAGKIASALEISGAAVRQHVTALGLRNPKDKLA